MPVAQVPNLTRAVREREWMKFDHLASHPTGVPERQHHHPVFCQALDAGCEASLGPSQGLEALTTKPASLLGIRSHSETVHFPNHLVSNPE